MPADPIDLKPFPPLPLELKGEILSHCDASTLAKASSASLAFLQLASPLLYRHITFVGPQGLKKFLTLRADVQMPSLAPYLDLSLVQSITYIDVEGQPFVPGIVCPDEEDFEVVDPDYMAHVFAPLRLIPLDATGPTFTPLALNLVHAKLLRESESVFWAFFNPNVLRVESTIQISDLNCEPEAHLFSDRYLSRATRLRELVLVDASPQFGGLALSAFATKEPWVLRYKLSDETVSAQNIGWIADDLRVDSRDIPTLGLEQVVIQVRTKAIKTAFLHRLASSPLLDRTTIVVKPVSAVAPEASSSSLPSATA